MKDTYPKSLERNTISKLESLWKIKETQNLDHLHHLSMLHIQEKDRALDKSKVSVVKLIKIQKMENRKSMNLHQKQPYKLDFIMEKELLSPST